MKFTGRLIVFTLILVALAAASKYFFGPDLNWSGFSPVIAIALFSGFIIRRKDISFIMPLLALFLSDVIIHILHNNGLFPYAGFYSGQWKNYLVILSATAIGWLLKGNNYSSLLAGGIISPTVFFLISNFMVWTAVTEAVYPRNFGGLMLCYEAGLPFYRNSLIATLVFLPVIVFIYNYVTRKRTQVTLA